MNKYFKFLVSVLTIGLVVGNISLFISSLEISEKIGRFEKETKAIHLENLKLEKKLSNLTSLDFAREQAKKMEFNKVADPTYLEKLTVAYNP